MQVKVQSVPSETALMLCCSHDARVTRSPASTTWCKEVNRMSGFTSNSLGPRSRGVPTKLRRRILARDRKTCQIQGPYCSVTATMVDHIIPVAEGGTDKVHNLQSVCESCHKIKTQEEAQRARVKFSRKRPPAPRPGSNPGRGKLPPGYLYRDDGSIYYNYPEWQRRQEGVGDTPSP